MAAVRRCELCGNHSELGYAIEQTQEWRQPRVDGVEVDAAIQDECAVKF